MRVEGQGLDVVFVATEVGPWSKAGGLGDVLQGLPSALARRGNHRVMTVAPRYRQYHDTRDTGIRIPLELPPGIKFSSDKYILDGSPDFAELHVAINRDGVFHCFVQHPIFNALHNKSPHEVYGTGYVEGGNPDTVLDLQVWLREFPSV